MWRSAFSHHLLVMSIIIITTVFLSLQFGQGSRSVYRVLQGGYGEGGVKACNKIEYSVPVNRIHLLAQRIDNGLIIIIIIIIIIIAP